MKSFKICQCFFISQTFLVKPYIFIDIFISVRSFIFIQFSVLKDWFRFETLKEDNLRAEMSLITKSGSIAEQSCCCHLHFSSNASKRLILDFFLNGNYLIKFETLWQGVVHQWRHANLDNFRPPSTHHHAFYYEGLRTVVIKYLTPP